MKVKGLILVLLAVWLGLAVSGPKVELVDYVNPYIGTTGQLGPQYGGTMLFVTPPFGMTHWTPMTRLNKIGRVSYHWKDKSMLGFIGTHQPAIWMGDYGYISLMPGVGKIDPSFRGRGIKFRHGDEVTKPHYYRVNLDDMKVEITATSRVGFFTITFPDTPEGHIYFDISRDEGFAGGAKIDTENNTITAWNSDNDSGPLGPPLHNFKGVFHIEFDAPITGYGVYEKGKVTGMNKSIKGDDIGAYVTFDTSGGKSIKVKIATSFIDAEQARQTMAKEIPHWDFNKTMNETKNAWTEQLEKILVKGGTNDMRAVFYTAMYHAHLYPREMGEYGRYYSAFDDKVHDGNSYNDFSLWDTFRAEHPLLIFTASERIPDMITALIQMYEEGGWLPKWPNPSYTGIMIGSHADSVIADAYIKGIRGFDEHKAYEAILKNATVPPDKDEEMSWGPRFTYAGTVETRGGLSWYLKLGYVPSNKVWESVSRTQEFAYDDFCVAQMAKALGKDEDYKMLMEHSRNYKNLFKNGFMRPRTTSGRFIFNRPYLDVTEGRKWTYQFCVMQDIPGLIELHGGDEAFEKKVDRSFGTFMGRKTYRHDNEPGHHHAYLYNYCRRPWKTQKIVREINETEYTNTPDGLAGNDDCGQMSAWYIFSSMGFYPVTPGSEDYSIGAPLWDEVTVKMGEVYGNTELKIIATSLSDENIYVQSVTLNGTEIKVPFLKHSELVKGGTLEYVMGHEPNYNLFSDY